MFVALIPRSSLFHCHHSDSYSSSCFRREDDDTSRLVTCRCRSLSLPTSLCTLFRVEEVNERGKGNEPYQSYLMLFLQLTRTRCWRRAADVSRSAIAPHYWQGWPATCSRLQTRWHRTGEERRARILWRTRRLLSIYIYCEYTYYVCKAKLNKDKMREARVNNSNNGIL